MSVCHREKRQQDACVIPCQRVLQFKRPCLCFFLNYVCLTQQRLSNVLIKLNQKREE